MSLCLSFDFVDRHSPDIWNGVVEAEAIPSFDPFPLEHIVLRGNESTLRSGLFLTVIDETTKIVDGQKIMVSDQTTPSQRRI